MKLAHGFGLILILVLAAADFGIANAAKAPSGSYRDSCGSVSASRDILRARCEKTRHRRVWTRLLSYSGCVGDISNYQGQLICLRRRDVPRGDWSESCINPHLSAPGVFAAECKSLRGGWIASEIALDKCPDGFTNARGHLGCKKPLAPAEPPPTAAPRSTLTPAPAPAEEPSDEPEAPSLPPPAGPYQDTCRSIAFDGRYLSGECRTDRGGWHDTSLDTKSCARDQVLGNDDGELVCTRRPGREPPAGLYSKTCKDVTFDGRFIRADCKDAKGTWLRAVLDMRACQEGDEIVNEDAEIICRAPAPPTPPVPPPSVTTPVAPRAAAPAAAARTVPSAIQPPPLPPGAPLPPPTASAPVAPSTVPSAASIPPRAPAPATPSPPTAVPSAAPAVSPPPPPPPAPANSITLYDGKGFEGASKTLTGDAPDLAPLGWIRIASSLQVKGGAWEVCEEANYGGRCERILEDEPDLGDIDFSDRISSLRQVPPSAPVKP